MHLSGKVLAEYQVRMVQQFLFGTDLVTLKHTLARYIQPITVNDSNNFEPEVTSPPTQLIKPVTKENEKPAVNNEYESDDDSYSEGNHGILKETETKNNLDRKQQILQNYQNSKEIVRSCSLMKTKLHVQQK